MATTRGGPRESIGAAGARARALRRDVLDTYTALVVVTLLVGTGGVLVSRWSSAGSPGTLAVPGGPTRTVASPALSSAAATSPAPSPGQRQLPTAPGTGTGRQVWVSPAGRDSWPGTRAAPLRTIGRATTSTRTRPGDVVHVAAGTYRESVVLGVSGSGTSGHITLVGEPGAVLRGPAGPGGGPDRAVLRASGVHHWMISGLTVDSTTGTGIRLAGTSDMIVVDTTVRTPGTRALTAGPLRGGGPDAVDGRRLTLAGNALLGSGRVPSRQSTRMGAGAALTVAGVDGFTVRDNVVEGGAGSGISVTAGSRHGLVTGNLVTGTVRGGPGAAGDAGGGRRVDGGRGRLFDVRVTRNDVKANGHDGIRVEDAAPARGGLDHVDVSYNVVAYNGGGRGAGSGIAVASDTAAVGIRNNTLYKNAVGMRLGTAGGRPTRALVVRSNVIASSWRTSALVSHVDGADLVDNVFADSGGAAFSVDRGTVAGIREDLTRVVPAVAFVGPRGDLTLRPDASLHGAGAGDVGVGVGVGEAATAAPTVGPSPAAGEPTSAGTSTPSPSAASTGTPDPTGGPTGGSTGSPTGSLTGSPTGSPEGSRTGGTATGGTATGAQGTSPEPAATGEGGPRDQGGRHEP